MTGRRSFPGTLKIRRVEKILKSTQKYYQEKVLGLIFTGEMQFFHPNDFHRVKFYQDNTTNYASKSTTAFLKKNKY